MVQAFIRRNPHHTIMNMMHLVRPWTMVSCMKYAYFANTCFVFLFCLLSFYLTRSAAAWSGFVLFCFVPSLDAT